MTWALRAVAVGFSFALPARAQAPLARVEVHVAVDCPALDPEHRAALESRAKADLMVRHEGGALGFTCREDGVVTWAPAGGVTVSERVSFPPGPDALVERFLESTDRLVLAARTPAPVDALPPQTVEPVPPQQKSGAENPPPEPPPGIDSPPEPPPPPSRPPESLPVDVAAGGVLELWDAVPALGASALVKWRFFEPFALDAGGSLLFTTGDRLGVSGRLVRLYLGGEAALGDSGYFRLGVRLLVDLMNASPAPGLSTSSATDSSVAGRLHAAYAFPVASFLRIVVGPTLGLRTAPVRVELGAREAFRIPVVAVGAEIQLEFGSR